MYRGQDRLCMSSDIPPQVCVCVCVSSWFIFYPVLHWMWIVITASLKLCFCSKTTQWSLTQDPRKLEEIAFHSDSPSERVILWWYFLFCKFVLFFCSSGSAFFTTCLLYSLLYLPHPTPCWAQRIHSVFVEYSQAWARWQENRLGKS